MNTTTRGTTAGLAALLVSLTAAAEPVTESRVWTEEFAVDSMAPRLAISNIWGSVRVRPGPEGRISMTIDERRTAPDRELFERSRDVLRLDVEANSEAVSIMVGEQRREWRHLDPCPGCRVDYQFEVQVPVGTQLDVGTVVDGTIDVVGVTGKVSASNVNGPIRIRELRECGALESVNGAVKLEFAQAPGQDCDIETVNGDVTLTLPDGSGLDVALDAFNGRIFSGFDVDPFALPAEVQESRSGQRRRYRIQQSAGLRIAGGGPRFSISSLNGDIRIQKYQ